MRVIKIKSLKNRIKSIRNRLKSLRRLIIILYGLTQDLEKEFNEKSQNKLPVKTIYKLFLIVNTLKCIKCLLLHLHRGSSVFWVSLDILIVLVNLARLVNVQIYRNIKSRLIGNGVTFILTTLSDYHSKHLYVS
jgi:hypothetical protein